MTEQEKTQLKGLVEYYISAFQELNKLESELESLNERKTLLSEKIKSTKEKEEKMMQDLRTKYGEVVNDPRYLMTHLNINFKDIVETK